MTVFGPQAPVQEPIDLANLQDEPLTPEQAALWDNVVTLLQWKAPGFTHIFYRMLATQHNEGRAKHVAVFTRQIPIAATDQENLYLNPDTFFRMPLAECVFVIAHEVCHNMLDDVSTMSACMTRELVTLTDGTTKPYDQQVANQAMDFRINDALVESKIGKLAEHIGLPGKPDSYTVKPCYDKNVGTQTDSWADIYGKIYEDNKGKSGGGKPGGKGFDVLLPGSNKPRNAQKWAVEVAAAQTIEAMRPGRGSMPAALNKLFQSILEPEVYWGDQIEALIARKVGSGGYTWNRPNRRFIGDGLYLPAHAGYGAGWIVIWADTSGSVWDQRNFEGYMGELAGLMEDLNPKRLTVLWGDSEVHDIDEIQDYSDLETIKARGVNGGGGTSVHPAFKWITEQNDEMPEMFIGFTDGDLGFPDEPPFPVIWASVKKDQKYPYGDVVLINQKRSVAPLQKDRKVLTRGPCRSAFYS